ncbi:MAG: acyl-CoA dehydrogenase family protein [Proteobacteria bacterium]|nr:acyl-CoA dehydrogenase family protein [Pseudomonadota bacterium]
MANFFDDNKDLQFHLEHTDLDDVITKLENNFTENKTYDYAPRNLKEARRSYIEALRVAGEITGTTVAANAEAVDEEGCHFDHGKVEYASGTKQNMKLLLGADLGGITIPRQYGGLNFPTTVSTMIIEMVSRADASLMNLIGLQDIGETINEFAEESMKAKYLPMFTKGEVTGAMILTEPDAGSDLQAVQTKAILDEKTGEWKLYGVKRFITNGCADISLVLARSELGSKDGRGLSMFLIEKDDTVQIRRIENKHGIHGSPTCEIQFNGTKALLIGKRKLGLIRYVISLMNGARLAVSAQGIGIAEAAYREALKYAKERVQFGSPIINFPAVYDMLTWMKVQIEGGRALIYETCKYVDLKKVYTALNEHESDNKEYRERAKKYSSIAALLTPLSKAYNTEMSNRVTYDAVQIHAGTGFMKEFPVERLSRDARITNIYEGTTQLQVIAAIGGILNGTYEELLKEDYDNIKFPTELHNLRETLTSIRSMLNKCINVIAEVNDKDFMSYYSRNIVDMATDLLIGYRLLQFGIHNEHKREIAKLFIEKAFANTLKLSEPVMKRNKTAMENRDIILEV